MIRVHRDDLCPVEFLAEPCGRPVAGWAWYDGGDHEPMLMQACYRHETDGAQGIADLVAERAALGALSWEMCPQDGRRLRDALGES